MEDLLILNLAGLRIAVRPLLGGLAAFAADYARPASAAEAGACDLHITITRQMIDAERELATEGTWSDGYLQQLALYRAIAEQAPRHGVFLMHAAVIGFGGKAYAFTATSGTGKSTHLRLWMDALGSGVQVINGDKPLMRVGGEAEAPGVGGAGGAGASQATGAGPQAAAAAESQAAAAAGPQATGAPLAKTASPVAAPAGSAAPMATASPITAYGTPWSGKEGWQANTSAPLAGLCLLERGDEDGCERVDAQEALAGALRQVYMPRDPESAFLTLGFLDTLLDKVPVYRLRCTMAQSAVRASFEAMTGLCFDDYRREKDRDALV